MAARSGQLLTGVAESAGSSTARVEHVSRRHTHLSIVGTVGPGGGVVPGRADIVIQPIITACDISAAEDEEKDRNGAIRIF